MKHIILSAFVALSLGSTLGASEKGKCTFNPSSSIEVNWTGYKTPAKIGVGGSFDKVIYKPAQKSSTNLQSLLVGSTVTIDSSSVNSKDEGRDATLAKFFFALMSKNSIDAKIIDIKVDKKSKKSAIDGVANVEIMMNGVKMITPMNFSYIDGTFSAKGVIDLFDFNANKALSSINKACYDLHDGKTWSDVAIGFTTKISSNNCK